MTEVTRKICVSIAVGDTDSALTMARKAADNADVLEIRLDTLAEPTIEPFLKELQVPLLFTCRPEWEGGEFSGSEKDRVALLSEAIKNGAAYIDIRKRAGFLK